MNRSDPQSTLPHASSAPAAPLTVALAGNPNCGKTTLFNALTGLRQKVANYPGVTVEKKTGRCHLPATDDAAARWVNVIDLPGTYSLISRSPDERVAMEVLRGLRPDTPPPDVVVVVVDASNLQRNLYLVSQLIELGRPLVVALNMTDVAARRGIDVSPQLLEQELGVPVIPLIGHKREGVDQLKRTIAGARIAPLPKFDLPASYQDELTTVGAGLATIDDSAKPLERYQALAERLLIGDTAGDLEPVAARDPVRSLVDASRARLLSVGIDPMQADIEAHYRWIEAIARKVTTHRDELAAMGNSTGPGDALRYETPRKRHLTEQVDAILIHKVWGLAIFALIMTTLFVAIFWLAAPVMEGIEGAIEALSEWVTGTMSDGPIKDLLQKGVFAGVGAVVVFIPQIAILFFFLALLEDSGYLARAAFLMDRLLAKVGLHGKSFIPLLSSFACAIPGIMATRTIEDRKSRLATILVAPFMSCSARLPVYTLLIGTFFATIGALGQAGIMLALYALGIVAAAVTAWFFKRSLLKGPTPAFILELPSYKVPQASQVGRQVFRSTWAFIAKAGTTIFCLTIILWAMTYYPRLPEATEAKVKQEAAATFEVEHADVNWNVGPTVNETGAAPPSEADAKAKREAIEKAAHGAQLRQSIAGRIGHAIEPAIRPLGYDWKMGVGLIGSFAAREVFVAYMGTIYSLGDPKDETADLQKAMQDDKRPDGKPVWTPLVAVSLLVWFVLAMQCMSTLAIVRRETGGWRWPVFMLVYMNGLAYVASLAVYQVGRIWWG